MFRWFKSTRGRRSVALVVAVLVVLVLTGCRTASFYVQAIKGQYQILARQQPVAKVLTNAATPEALRHQLTLANELRDFAARRLALPVDGHYKRYADLGRPFVVWNVQAAREFSLEPKTWWYPFLGSLQYRGYFSREGAHEYAGYLEQKGSDVFVGSVTAYSTLGWFKDPLLNTFIFEPEPVLAETLFHELAHQRVFAGGDTDFNEAFATAVGEEGARRWLKARGSEALLTNYLAQLQRTRQFVAITGKARRDLEALFGDWRTAEGDVRAAKHPPDVPPEVLRARKAEIYARLREDYQKLNDNWGHTGDYDSWFKRKLNNAQLNSVAAYYDLVPAFEYLLQLNDNDLETFYGAVDRLAKMSKKDRHAWMQNLTRAGANAQGEPPGPGQ